MTTDVTGPPSGSVTLVFTDIEGSTRLLQALGDRYRHVLDDHRSIMRDAWNRWNGYEMGTEGDSFFVSFPSASDAVAAVVEAQRTLAEHAWPDGMPVRVRIGMHTGSPMVVGGDYVGIDVHRAARIASAGHGGQVVLSKVTRDLVEHALPVGVTLRDLGEHRLKDLEEPEWLFQLVIEGLQETFAAPKSLETPTNLPLAPSEFIGREDETAQLVHLLQGDETRLVTLTGTGGTGKTRFAIHVASHLLDRFKNGVFFASIGPSVDADSVPSEIAAALQIPEQGGRMPLDAILSHLRDKSVLLVLDNFEHVLDAAPFVSGLIAAVPRLKMIVTSRARLHVSGEREFPLAPLPVPADARDLEALARSGAVALFVQRAQSMRPDFKLTAANAQPILEICRRLDGLPLAIELAASKTKVLSPEQILERLSSRLALLKGGARDLPARQQTLRDTIGWSYELLDEEAARLFRMLAVFSGGATLDAIEGVAGADVLDALGSLVDHSLVRQDAEPRFSMLETIREYALERMEEAGESEKARRAHAEHMLRVVEEAGAGLRGPEQNRWRRILEAEHDNMRGALAWCFADGDPNLGARIAIRLGQFWYSHGFAVDGIGWLEQARAKATDLPPDLQALLLQRLGILFDQRGIAARAAVLFEQAAALYRELGDQNGTAFALNSLGSAERSMGNVDGAEALWNESLSLRRALDDKSGVAATLCNLGTLALDRGEPERAREFLEEARAIDAELGDDWAVAIDESGLAEVALDLGEVERARPILRRALDAFCEMGEHDRLAETLSRLAGLAAALGDPARSARLSGAAEALWENLGIPLAPPDRARFEHFQERARAALDPVAYEQAWTEGHAMTMTQVVAYALADGAG